VTTIFGQKHPKTAIVQYIEIIFLILSRKISSKQNEIKKMSRNRRKRNDAAYYFYKMPRLPRLCGGGLVTLDHSRTQPQVKKRKKGEAS